MAPKLTERLLRILQVDLRNGVEAMPSARYQVELVYSDNDEFSSTGRDKQLLKDLQQFYSSTSFEGPIHHEVTFSKRDDYARNNSYIATFSAEATAQARLRTLELIEKLSEAEPAAILLNLDRPMLQDRAPRIGVGGAER